MQDVELSLHVWDNIHQSRLAPLTYFKVQLVFRLPRFAFFQVGRRLLRFGSATIKAAQKNKSNDVSCIHRGFVSFASFQNIAWRSLGCHWCQANLVVITSNDREAIPRGVHIDHNQRGILVSSYPRPTVDFSVSILSIGMSHRLYLLDENSNSVT